MTEKTPDELCEDLYAHLLRSIEILAEANPEPGTAEHGLLMDLRMIVMAYEKERT